MENDVSPNYPGYNSSHTARRNGFLNALQYNAAKWSSLKYPGGLYNYVICKPQLSSLPWDVPA